MTGLFYRLGGFKCHKNIKYHFSLLQAKFYNSLSSSSHCPKNFKRYSSHLF